MAVSFDLLRLGAVIFSHINDSNISQIILGPCRNIKPFYEQLASNSSLDCYTVDVDKVQVAQAQLRGIPAFQFWKNGNLVAKITGASVDPLKAFFDECEVSKDLKKESKGGEITSKQQFDDIINSEAGVAVKFSAPWLALSLFYFYSLL